MQTRWHTSDTDQAWLVQALAFVARAEREALATRGEFHIVLAGGDTPRRVYAALAQEVHDWSHWQVWFGDERCLPAGHPERNSTMAGIALLDHVPVDAVHTIPGELGARAAATAYAGELAGVGRFDLVLLGLGEDGHTASLFPGHSDEDEADVLPVFAAPKPPPERVTLSAGRLSCARRVLFLVSGAGKADALRRWRAGGPFNTDIPAATIQPESGVDVLLAPDLSTSGVIP
jgi:6-phosphogluconolactonase